MYSARLNPRDPRLARLIRHFDFDMGDPWVWDDPIDMVPHMPEDPLIVWCTQHCQGKFAIVIQIDPNRKALCEYLDNFLVTASFDNASEALLFKLSWA